jgi:hypothetical protein
MCIGLSVGFSKLLQCFVRILKPLSALLVQGPCLLSLE